MKRKSIVATKWDFQRPGFEHSGEDKTLTISKLLLSTSVLAVMAFPALAQERTFRSIDTNQNGVLERGELEEAFGSSGAIRVLSRSDSDGDGKITRSELRQSGDDDESDDDESDDDEDDDSEDDDRSDEGDDDEDDDSGSDESGDDEDDDEDDDSESGESDDDEDDDEDDDSGSDESDDDEDDD